jgi:capsular polysaccharide transport system permease protein
MTTTGMDASHESWRRRNAGWLIWVALPTLLATLYFGLIASDLYAATASFVVRAPGQVSSTGLSSLLQGTTLGGGGQENTYAVQTYATSRDAIRELGQSLDLKALFSRPEADVFSRYPNLIDHDNAEDFERYFQRRVEVLYDTTTGLTTLTAKAFRPEDAQALAEGLLHQSEALVNRLNARARDSAVRYAEADVQAAQDEVKAVQASLLGYRNRESMLDPLKASGAIFEAQAKTEAELTQARTRLAELQRSAPQSPLRAELQSHVNALEAQLAQQRGRLTGHDDALAPKLSGYEQISLQKEFATKKLSSALASLEAARATAQRQQVYLERVVDVQRPERALYPRRLQDILIVFISCFMVYSIARLLLAGVREHAQQ